MTQALGGGGSRAAALSALVALISWIALALVAQAEPGRHVNVATITGSINPASANYLIQAIERTEQENAAALLIELDTPGGLVSSTKDILQAMLNADVPVVVYVSPRGAWASSAGTFITVAAHVAAMAPGTSIGAAHPVSAVGGSAPTQPGEEGEEGQSGGRDFAAEKAENFLAAYVETIARERGRNVDWVVQAVRRSVAIGEDEALELNVIDLVAGSRRDLLSSLEGREVELVSGSHTIHVDDAELVQLEMTLLQRIFDVVADPNIAWLLMAGAALGLYLEFNSPGLILPGVTGVVCLVLLLISLQILPFSWIGLLLVIVGLGLWVAELFVASLGALFAVGVLCLLLGGTMLFDKPELSDLTISFWEVLVPSVVGVSLFGGIVVFALGRSLWVRQTAGVDELIGLVGRATTAIPAGNAGGKVFVRGEYWNASAPEVIGEGEPVEVTEVEGLRLRVRRASQLEG